VKYILGDGDAWDEWARGELLEERSSPDVTSGVERPRTMALMRITDSKVDFLQDFAVCIIYRGPLASLQIGDETDAKSCFPFATLSDATGFFRQERAEVMPASRWLSFKRIE
jgi:hypothetical protein